MTPAPIHIPSVLLLLAAAVAPVSPATAQARASVLVLRHANVIDGLSPRPIQDATVVVRDGRIESVSVGSVKTPDGATVFDLRGGWLLPGLVDAHTHLRDLETARAVLATGVTTARSLGADRLTDIGIRELNHAGVANLPDVVAAGYQIRRTLNETFFLDFPQLSDLMTGVRGPEAVRRIVRAQAQRGVNVIKVMATERTALPQTDPLRRVFTGIRIARRVRWIHAVSQ